jgi:hypothetical protein
MARRLPDLARALLDDFEAQVHGSPILHRIVALIDARCRETLERFEL